MKWAKSIIFILMMERISDLSILITLFKCNSYANKKLTGMPEKGARRVTHVQEWDEVKSVSVDKDGKKNETIKIVQIKDEVIEESSKDGYTRSSNRSRTSSSPASRKPRKRTSTSTSSTTTRPSTVDDSNKMDKIIAPATTDDYSTSSGISTSSTTKISTNSPMTTIRAAGQQTTKRPGPLPTSHRNG